MLISIGYNMKLKNVNNSSYFEYKDASWYKNLKSNSNSQIHIWIDACKTISLRKCDFLIQSDVMVLILIKNPTLGELEADFWLTWKVPPPNTLNVRCL